MLGKGPPHHVLIDFDTEGFGDLLCDPGAPKPWVPSFHLNDDLDKLQGGPFGPGLPLFRGENSNRYLRFLSASWNFNSVDGLMTTAARRIWCGLRNNDQKPSRNRSSAERFGARCLARLTTRSCCFRRRLSATTAFTPPGPMSLARVVNRCMRSTIRSFIGRNRVGQIAIWRKFSQAPVFR